MAKKKIIQKHSECIGCGTCVALCSDFWEFDNENKVRPRGGKKNSETGNYELIIDEKDVKCNQEAADACPSQAICLADAEE